MVDFLGARRRSFLVISLLIAVAAAALSNLLFSVRSQTETAIVLAVDTADADQDGLLVVYGAQRLGGQIGMPVGAGDLTGDSRADVAFCEMYASAGAGNRINNGQVNFYISDGRDSGFVDAAVNPPNIFTLVGAQSGDLLGTSVAVGDVNHDGLGDVVVCASANDGPQGSRFNSGAVYLVPGSQNFNLHADLQTLDGVPPAGIKVIYGPQAFGRFGIWVDTGDLDGDGTADIVVGADQLNTPAGPHAGGAFIIFGSPSLPQVIDLASPPGGVRIARVLGTGEEDHNGAALHVGDINNDGIGDLVLGASIFRDSGSYVSPDDQETGHNARGANFGGLRPGAGEVNVIFGRSDWPSVIDLSTHPAGVTRVIGAKRVDFLGSQVFSADLNGDGAIDLILGALQAEAPDGRGRTGAVYIVYGQEGIVGATIDLANPNASGLNVVTIFGENNLDCAGDSVRSYDVNRDGRSDLFIGSPEHTLEIDGVEREDAGDTKIIFGQPGFLPPLIKLYDLPPGLTVYRLAGADGEDQGIGGGDEFSYRLTGGDVDGDGFVDYISNAMRGDGFQNRIINAGEFYVFSGKKLSAKLGLLPTGPEPGPTLVSARLMSGGQIVQQANAGQRGLQVLVEGIGLRGESQISINDMTVSSVFVTDPGVGFPSHRVELDQNASIRDTVGPLTVRAVNVNPPSLPSNPLVAGTLSGPQISSISPKRKGTGALILRVNGTGFQLNMSLSVIGPGGQPVATKSTTVESPEFLRSKIAVGLVQPGASLRVRTVVTTTSVRSNEIIVTAP